MTFLIVDDPVYGKQEITNPSVISIIQTPEFQRLKGINQYGVGNYMTPKMPTTRYSHSVGVYLFLRKLGATFEEQLAGLLHDISHTAFSHVIDYFFKEYTTQEFHHNYFHSIISNSKIKDIVEKEGFSVKQITDHDRFKILEAEGKELNADRLDYAMRDGILFGTFKKDVVEKALSSFVINDGKIVMSDKESAAGIAWGFFNTSRRYWTHPLFGGSYEVLCVALRIAKDKGIITEKDFFLTDDEIMKKVRDAKNDKINYYLDNIDWTNLEECGPERADFKVVLKPRYIDPPFIDGERIVRYSEVDDEFKKKVEMFVDSINRGFSVRIKK